MSTRLPRTPVYETHAAVHPHTLPPPPPRTAAYPAGLPREHVGSPSTLTVIPVTYPPSHQSTPLSAVSHQQSPFSPHSSTPGRQTSRAASRGTSPMAARPFAVQYDPRDWASGDVRANQARRAAQQAAEDGLAEPPPPYSPQNDSPRQPERSIVIATGAADATLTARTSTTQRPPRHMNSVSGTGRPSLQSGFSIPPPPPPSSSSRQVSQPVLSPNGFHNGDMLRDESSAPAAYPPAARRAVSAHAGPSIGEPPPGRMSSARNRWHPGMPLPGPPPGPPPSSSRSQSLNNTRERSGSSGAVAGPSRSYTTRYTSHTTDLGPIPATPAGWNEDQPLPPSSDGPLHINTNIRSEVQHSPSNVLSATVTQTPAPILSRSPAVRDSSVKGLRERRAQNRSSRLINTSDLDDLSVQTNTASDPPDHGSARSTIGPSSAHLSAPLRPKALSPMGNILAHGTSVNSTPTTVAMSPFSPPAQTRPREQGPRSGGLPPRSLLTPPLNQRTPVSAHTLTVSTSDQLLNPVAQDVNNFLQDAARRHAEFLEKERTASSDAERLHAFAEFVLFEARIRQQRYEHAFSAGDFDPEFLRSKLFSSASESSSFSNSTGLAISEGQGLATGNTTPQTRPESHWKDYQPALSPIMSMDYDEMSSRGRAPSRWWESQTGSVAGDRNAQLKRTKRESKYMGLSKEFLMAHSPGEDSPSLRATSYFPTDSSYLNEKANPETFGFYDDDDARPVQVTRSKAPETPRLLDISRFITLPPPYPRHYPAVNNSHPDLAQYRTTVRTLSGLDEVRTRKSRQRLGVEALQTELQRKLTEGRRAFRGNIQAQIQDGSITYAEAAEAEEAHKMNEMDMEKQSLQAEFDTLQDVVINPLHDMLNGRIIQLDSSIQTLQNDLRSDAHQQDPDRPQEEGDETPELLEKLTQLKWLFDTREQIHKECFDLLSDRNNKFMAIVLLPYRQAKNVEKTQETEMFFERDTQTRFVTYCDASFQRHKEILKTIDEHVQRGVELQSSAFWDIAPGLLDLLQKLPENLRQLPGLQIPAKEYEENPSYHQHPHQYLYSLLSHAEKSTYQFIEGQVNLHCLLHEVKTSQLAARYRLLEAQEKTMGTSYDGLAASREEEDSVLTGELKQKASLIEEQWLEALGSQLQGTRERVKALLQEDDAWEEIAQDDA